MKRNIEKDLYKVAFSSPISWRQLKKWISVCDITSTTMDKEREKKKKSKKAEARSAKAAHRKKYKLAYNSERVFMKDRLDSAHFHITYDPPGDGNCQFSVVCALLRSIGLYQSVETLREQVVQYLENHPHMQNFVTVTWPTYLGNMARDGTYGDHLTLQAAADLLNVEFIVISSLGPAATTIISPTDSLPLCSFHIGHFAEGDGEHYVGLQNDPIWQDIYGEETAVESDIIPASKNNTAQEPSNSLSRPSNINVEATFEHSHAQELISELLVSDRDSTSQPPLPPTCASDLPLSEASINDTAALPHRSSFLGSADQAPVLNQDVLEHIIIQTLAMFPYMWQPSRVVSRFFREIVDKEPLPKIYIPEINNIANSAC